MPRRSTSRSAGSRSLDNAELARTLWQVAEALREYVQGIRRRPDQLTAIAFAMMAEAAFIDRLADDLERRR